MNHSGASVVALVLRMSVQRRGWAKLRAVSCPYIGQLQVGRAAAAGAATAPAATSDSEIASAARRRSAAPGGDRGLVGDQDRRYPLRTPAAGKARGASPADRDPRTPARRVRSCRAVLLCQAAMPPSPQSSSPSDGPAHSAGPIPWCCSRTPARCPRRRLDSRRADGGRGRNTRRRRPDPASTSGSGVQQVRDVGGLHCADHSSAWRVVVGHDGAAVARAVVDGR